MTTKELKEKYLKFFEGKGHKIIPNASLIPEHDPTVLFTTAGMHPLISYLLGEKHPAGNKLVNNQKCIRTSDIEKVGNNLHLTFFEMLGNWSLGDPDAPDGVGAGYWKEDAIKWSLEFLTDKKWLSLDKDKISVSCFKGDKDVSKDTESAKIWESMGIPKNRIKFLGREENWWGPAGKTGPCGPCTEMFYWVADEKAPEEFNPDKKVWVEIWNNVFMEHNKQERTILVDGMFCLYDKDFKINEKLLNFLNKVQARKILVINAFGDKAKKLFSRHEIEVFTFEKKVKKENKEFFMKLFKKYNLTPNEILYFDHAKENLEGAKSAGIKLIKQFKDNEKKINKFINKNLFCYEVLKQKNVDTGMGVERTVATLNGAASVYESSESLIEIIRRIEKLSNKRYSYPDLRKIKPSGTKITMFTPNIENKGWYSRDKEIRIIADHLRAATFILGDEKEIVPSNVEHGYVLRRLIRRAINEGRKIGIRKTFTHEIAEIVIKLMGNEYPELKKNKDFITEQFIREEEKFEIALTKAEPRKNKRLAIINRMKKGKIEKGDEKWITSDTNTAGITIDVGKLDLKDSILKYSASASFVLETTHGYPHDLFFDDLRLQAGLNKEGIERITKLFIKSYLQHQELSRTAMAGKFKSGLADHSEEVTKLHTATHLLLAALRQVLGEHVYQKGSNITAERLRFDFSHVEKMIPEQIKRVEDIVNKQIKKDSPVICNEMFLEEAKKIEAIGVFETKYSDKVKVYTIGDFSKEICNGPHVKSIAELGRFKIKKEESSSAGVRRIRAVLE